MKLQDSQRGKRWGPGIMRPQDEWFLEPQWLSSWELCHGFLLFYPMTSTEFNGEKLRGVGNAHFPNTQQPSFPWVMG